MASEKRKADVSERSTKKARTSKEEQRPKDEKPRKTIKASEQDSSERRPVPKSVLQQEERAFPRGGASVLTPIEQKQIKAQAERDVLFEQQTGRSIGGQYGDAELYEEPVAVAQPRRRKQEKQSSEGWATHKAERSRPKIHGLSYKNLVVGSVVLGYVTAITNKDIALALANNLTGFVPITSVSAKLNERIERLLLDQDDQDAADEENDVDLKSLFHVGQWLRAVVTATSSESSNGSNRSKRHIELSLDPRQVNGAVEADGMVVNSMIQASVRSVEDHGLVMDVGVSDSSVKGFVSKKELGVLLAAALDNDQIQEGQVLLCLVTGKGSNGKVLKLSPDAGRFSVLIGGKNAPSVNEAPSVDGFQPGTAVEVLITDVTAGGVAGKLMGMIDVIADAVHSGAGGNKRNLADTYKIGSKVKGRIIWSTPANDGNRRIGISLLEANLALPPPASKLPENASAKLRSLAGQLEGHLALSSIVEDATVKEVKAERGLFLSLPGKSSGSAAAFAHISQISDDRIDNLSASSGQYKLDSTHRVRIISYNPIDNLHYVSLQRSVLDQPFLRIEDLKIGEPVKGTVERLLLGAKGVTGVLLKLSEAVTGLVPEIHLSDVHLQHPERKFKEGVKVKARVLSVDLDKRQVRLTAKKLLLEEGEESSIWQDYSKLAPGMTGKGTVVNFITAGAVLQFYGDVRAWLPVAEMSETFVERPDEHFRLGQTVNVRIVSLNAEAKQMKVSCKDPFELTSQQSEAWTNVLPGQIVSGTVAERNINDVVVTLAEGLKGIIRIGHLSDTLPHQMDSILSKMHVGRTLVDLLVLEKQTRNQALLLTRKSSMVDAAKLKTFISSFDNVCAGEQIHGFVRNVTPFGVYVEFGNGVVGLLPKANIAFDMLEKPDFGLQKDQSLAVWVVSVEPAKEQFSLAMREPVERHTAAARTNATDVSSVSNPVDSSIHSIADFAMGTITKARIASIKGTQINVRLADSVQGRIDASEVFDTWDEIANKRAPLQKFKQHDTIDVKILGVHDARNHRFLPISHRQSSVTVFELSAKRSRVVDNNEDALTMESIKPGVDHLAFINNHADSCVWASISPNVRGRIALMDLSDDVGSLQNLDRAFPVGSAVRVTVKSVDPAANRLDLTAKRIATEAPLTLSNISPGMVLPGRVTKLSERTVTVQLSDALASPIPLVELADDYDELRLGQYRKNDVVRAAVVDVDIPNKKIFLSLRPSKVLSSSLPVRDMQITSCSQLTPGDVVRGFIKRIGDNGVYVALGARVDAIVWVSDLSDRYVKDWKTVVQVDELVTGRIKSVDSNSKLVQMSLKASHVDANYKAPLSITDLEIGTVVTGKVRKVEDFGAFIDIDNTQPRLSGLCHRSEIAARRVEDVRKLYSAGDIVKAKILNVDVEARKISLGLKASYFANNEAQREIEEDTESDSGIDVSPGDRRLDTGDDLDSAEDVDLNDVEDMQSVVSDGPEADTMDINDNGYVGTSGLETSGFDWTGDVAGSVNNDTQDDFEPQSPARKKRKRQPEIKVDKTGDVDTYGPRSVSDFERQLLGEGSNSGLWIQYMAFQLELSEMQKARDIAQRALRTIHIRDVEEKANVWIAWLNLEVEYGDEERVEDVFKQACQVQDPLEMHEKLASIYIDSGKHGKADAVFEQIIGNKAFRASPEVWLNYANFLMNTLESPLRARALLSRALQSVPTNEHRLLTAKFAALEFHSPQGDPERGRTIFEGLITEWSKWSSGWDMFADLERARIAHAASKETKAEAVEKVRALYNRMAGGKMKKRRARFVFKRWLEFEEEHGTAKQVERVKALAKEYVEAQQAKGGDDMEE